GTGDALVVERVVEDLGDESGADSVQGVEARLAPGEDGRGRRLDGVDAGGGAFGPQHAAAPGDRPARADPGDERVDLRQLREQLARRRLPVDLRVGGGGGLLRP